MTGKTRKMFPGGNTANGFYSFFDYIIPNDVNRIFCLKGGPGVGKSSFMKKWLKNLQKWVTMLSCIIAHQTQAL